MAGDIVPDIKDCYAFVGARVGDRSLEERESRSLGGREWRNVIVLAVLSVKVEVHLAVQCRKKFLPCLMVVHRGEVEGIAVGNRSAQVVMVGIFIGQSLFRMEFVNADLQCPPASGVGVADGAAIPARDVHHGFVGIELPEDMTVYVGSP